MLVVRFIEIVFLFRFPLLNNVISIHASIVISGCVRSTMDFNRRICVFASEEKN